MNPGSEQVRFERLVWSVADATDLMAGVMVKHGDVLRQDPVWPELEQALRRARRRISRILRAPKGKA